MRNERMEQIISGVVESTSYGEKYLVRAYQLALEHGIQCPVFYDIVIWENDVPDIIEAIRQAGFKRIFLANNQSGLLNTLALFQNAGGRLGHIHTLSWGSKWEQERTINAIKIFID